jgi:hypothetical protein
VSAATPKIDLRQAEALDVGQQEEICVVPRKTYSTQPQESQLDGLESVAAFQRFTDAGEYRGARARILDIPETITELGYGSHQFFRYYGKFPSFVGKELVKSYGLPGHAVLDNYAGSGTTQVESQIHGLTSFGLDINPLAVISSNVKTGYFNLDELRRCFSLVAQNARLARGATFIPAGMTQTKLEKWFPQESIDALGRLHDALLALPLSPERSFLLVCFLAVVRRCSFAFDGEVRPHVNKIKRPRHPDVAFKRKFEDMVNGLSELNGMRKSNIRSHTTLGDNRVANSLTDVNEPVGLVVSHPPYLNSFNYLQVFSLEFAWGEGFNELWQGKSLPEIRQMEQKAWPATDPRIVSEYYDAITNATQLAQSVLAAGGTLAVVVGDATIRGVLEPVHEKLWDRIVDIGLAPHEIWYRTTHYGVGKYAYSHRADYHGAAEKKDAIMLFTKV